MQIGEQKTIQEIANHRIMQERGSDSVEPQNGLLKHSKVAHVTVGKDATVKELIESMANSGVFNAGRLAKACQFLKEMKETGVTVFLGLAGAMVPGGMRQVVVDMIKEGLVHVIVSTGANMTHDLVEAFGGFHMRGIEYKNDVELREKGIDRVYDAYLTDEGFMGLEDGMVAILDEIRKDLGDKGGRTNIASYVLLREIGKRIEDPNSIVRVAYEHNVPIFIPAIADSILGLNVWLNGQLVPFQIDPMKDLTEIQSLADDAENAGAFLIGGGVPKNYIFQARLMSPKTYEYAIQITMDRVETGGLSGASLDEAISWGKTSAKSKLVTVICDATIAMPIMLAYCKSV